MQRFSFVASGCESLGPPIRRLTAAISEGKATLLGIEGKGSKFVYVFDRSGSMSVPNNKPLDRAKTELLRSIDALTDLQQFYIIFYNHEQKSFRIDPSGKRLIFGSDLNKRLARQFVDGIAAGGGTHHADGGTSLAAPADAPRRDLHADRRRSAGRSHAGRA